MKKIILPFLLVTFLMPFGVQAQVTFSEHIAPIIYNNCTSCHRAGEVGPIPFTNYQEVADWADMIKYVTEIKYMPPWSPDANYRHYLNERVLTDEEIKLIGEWADAGAPRGDAALEPSMPDFPTGSQIGTPDLVLEMETAHLVKGDNQDDYQVFVLPTNFTEDKEIASIELRPGNNRAVHHVLFAYDVTGKAAAKDAATPEYGYYSFGDFGVDEAVYLSWGYVPGVTPIVYPKGIGEIIPAGADLLIHVHYAPLPTDETDQSSINIFFKEANDPITRPIKVGSTLPFNLPGGWDSFRIPPNEVTTFKAESFYEGNSFFPGVNYDVSLISIDAHSHYLGKSYEIFVVTPDRDTLNLLKIPDWDFNWQGTYTFEKMMKIPAGSKWYTIAAYDNTINNPANPNHPPKMATWGEGTDDEMLLTGLYFVPYQEGDEAIELGGSLTTSTIEVNALTNSSFFAPSPNPSNGMFTLNFELTQRETLQFDLYNLNGQLVETISPNTQWSSGKHRIEGNISNVVAGNYLVKMIGENYSLSQKIVIVK